MSIRRSITLVALVGLGASGIGACGLGSTAPTAAELDEPLRSVAGDWTGFNTVDPAGPPPQTLTLRFRLAEAPDGRVTGTGTMQERDAPAAVPITVTGTYRRPDLALTFEGMVYAGRAVRGTINAPYTSVAGVVGPLALTSAGFAATLPVLLQEVR